MTKPQPRATNLSTRRHSGHPAIPVDQRDTANLHDSASAAVKTTAESELQDELTGRTAQVSARVTKARRAAFKAKLAQLGTTMDAEFNKCIDEVLAR